MWTSGHIYNYVAHRLHMQMFHNKTATVSQHRSPSGLKAKHTSLLLVHPRFHTNPLHSACRWHHRVARNCYEAVYRHDLQSDWCCSINNLAFNTSKTKQMIISFSRQKENPAPLNKGGDNVENVPTLNSSAQTESCILSTVRRNKLTKQLLVLFYSTMAFWCEIPSSLEMTKRPLTETKHQKRKPLSLS